MGTPQHLRRSPPSCVLFDLDDCLVDYAGAKRRGQARVSESLDRWGVPAERFWAAYARVEPDLFARFARGEMTAGEYREARYRLPAAACDRELTAARVRELNRLYMDEANGRVPPLPGACRALRRLRAAGVRVGILTSGPADGQRRKLRSAGSEHGQRRKLRSAGLEHAVDACFISEEIGVGKPDERAFEIALAELGAEPSASAMVGDSFAVDLEPAIRLGMRGVRVGPADGPAGVERVARVGDVPDALGIASDRPARTCLATSQRFYTFPARYISVSEQGPQTEEPT